jgi:hypothetical protein
MDNKIIDKTPCDKCMHEEICAHKEAHNESINSLNNLNDVMPFSGLDIIHVSCSKFTQKPINLR